MKLKKNAISLAVAIQVVACATASASDTVPRSIKYVRQWDATTRKILAGATGYINAGEKIAIGPIASFVGYNTLEGLRLGVGGRTTPALSPYLSATGNIAFGFIDHKLKYSAEAIWSVVPVRNYFGSYPARLFTLSYSYDTFQLGENTLYATKAAAPFRFSLRRNEMILYRRMASLGYFFEPARNVLLKVSASREHYYPTRYITFAQPNAIAANRFLLTVGWFPGGDFYQSNRNRINTKPYAPALRARMQIVRSEYSAISRNMMIAEAAVEKLIPLSQRLPAALRVMAHGATTIGRGSFPLLPSLPSSPYILRRFGSFALLSPLELPADRLADTHILIDDGGFVLGKIPGLRFLDWSLTASVDIAVGALSGGNNPSLNPTLPPFPYSPERMLSWKRPYSEVGIGLSQIFGVGRIEYVRRLTYLSGRASHRHGISLGIDLTI